MESNSFISIFTAITENQIDCYITIKTAIVEITKNYSQDFKFLLLIMIVDLIVSFVPSQMEAKLDIVVN